MLRRRARLIRLVLAISNLTAVLAALLGATVYVLAHDRPEPPPVRAHSIPEAFSTGEQPLTVDLGIEDVRAPMERTRAYDDLMILLDGPRDFSRNYRVIFASLDAEPQDRRCIVVRRDAGEQIVLVPGERMGSWLLIAIEPEPTAPRSVRLRFRDLRRGEEVTAVLAPDA